MEREDERVRRRNDGVAVRPPPRAEFGDFFFFRVGSSGVHAARAAKWTRGRNREAERTSEEKKEYK